MKEKLLTLCIDVEAFDLPNDFGREISQEKMYQVSLQGLSLLYEILERLNIKATFFVTKGMAERFPEEITRLAMNGHEIAVHSVFTDIRNEEKIFEELKEQKTFIENTIKVKVCGHRSHKFLPISLNKLKEIGLLYDNSLHPTYVPGRYCNVFRHRNLYKEDGMIEVPVTVTPLLRFPFSCFWFRILKVPYAKLCSQFTYFSQDYINIYFHSWEFGNISGISLKWPYKLLIKDMGGKIAFGFVSYLDWIIGNNIAVVTMLAYVQSQLAKDI